MKRITKKTRNEKEFQSPSVPERRPTRPRRRSEEPAESPQARHPTQVRAASREDDVWVSPTSTPVTGSPTRRPFKRGSRTKYSVHRVQLGRMSVGG